MVPAAQSTSAGSAEASSTRNEVIGTGFRPSDHDIIYLLQETPDGILQVYAKQEVIPLQNGAENRGLGNTTARILFSILQWHVARFPGSAAPTGEIFARSDWFSFLMSCYLQARAVWSDEDLAELSAWWSQNNQAARTECQDCHNVWLRTCHHIHEGAMDGSGT